MFNALIFKYDVCLFVCFFNFKKLFHLAQVAHGEQSRFQQERTVSLIKRDADGNYCCY